MDVLIKTPFILCKNTEVNINSDTAEFHYLWGQQGVANRDGWPEQLVLWAPDQDRVSADRNTGTPAPRAYRLYWY